MLRSLISAMVFTMMAITPVLSVHAAASVGDLVMCDNVSTVYFLAEDGNRYAFPNEQIYFSWYEDFDEVKRISCESLAALPLAGNVVYQAGTTLVKLQTSPTVYAVESNGVLRAIGSEEQAMALYGDDWVDFVDDLPDPFFSSFELGDALSEGELPEGMILTDEVGTLLRVSDDGSAVEIDDALDQEDDERLLSAVAEPLDDVTSRIRIEVRVSSLADLDAESILSS